MPSWTRENDVCLLDLGDCENRMSPSWLEEVETALDRVEAEQGVSALITVASGKFWSYGFDLDWMEQHPTEVDSFVAAAQAVMARVLVFSIPTVAAIQGHAFAAGAMLALAHDYRLMRTDRGFICAPEVDIKIPLTRGMSALFAARLSQPALHQVLVTGRRYGALDAQRFGLVDDVASEHELKAGALQYARAHGGKDRATLAAIKSELYAGVVASLREPVHVVLPGLASA